MRSGEVVLCVDYGSTGTAAVLVDRDGGWVALGLDTEQDFLSSGVFLDLDGSWLVGDAAWRAGVASPERFEASPQRWLRQNRVRLGGSEFDPLDAIAATLRRVAQRAEARLGAPPGQVRLVVPPGWGPRRRTAMREAARRAGLGAPDLVEAPVAAAAHLVAGGRTVMVGSFLLVCDWGGGLSATVLRRSPYGFEVLSTLGAYDAGGLALDQALAGRLPALVDADAEPSTVEQPAEAAWWAAARQARETLSRAPVVTVTPPAGPPVVLTAAAMLETARPVVQRAAAVLQQAVAAAELPAEQIAEVFCVGGVAGDQAMVELLAKESGLAVVAVSDPRRAAVLGAAHAAGPARDAAPPVEPAQPRARRAGILLIPGLAAGILYGHFLWTADLHRGQGIGYDPAAYLLANWGELALSGVFNLVTFLVAAVMIAAALPVEDPETEAGSPLRDTQQIGAGLLAAAAFGVAFCGLEAVFGAVILHSPTGPFLRWAILPLLPIAAVVAATAALATRWGRVPSRGWHGWLNFPQESIWVATVGMVLVQVADTTPLYPALHVFITAAARIGGLLIGLAAALLVARRRVYRLIAVAPLCVFTAGIVGPHTTGILALLYVAAATGWWAHRAWALANQPAGFVPRRR